MKKIFGKANTYSLLLDIACIFLFFAPFVVCKGTVTASNIQYVTGFELIFGDNYFAGLSLPVVFMLGFISLAVLVNLFAYKFKSLSWLNVLLEWGTAVLMFIIVTLVGFGFQISPSSWSVSVYAGSMVIGSLLILSGLCSIVNGFPKFKKTPEISK